MRVIGEERLASFIGVFFGVAGLLGLLCRMFFTGKLLGRFGVRVALFLQPALLILIAVMAVAAGGLELLFVLFWLISSMKMLSSVLTESVDLPALNIAYQPLLPDQRVQVQTLVEGVVYSVSIGLAGIVLSASARILAPGSIALVLVLLAVLLAWAALANLLGREYPKKLIRALHQRSLGPTKLLLAEDGESLSLLKRELSSPHPGVVIYAMDTLEAIKPQDLIPSLPSLLGHPTPEVRRDVLGRVERQGWTYALPAVRQRVTGDSSPAVRGAAVRTLAILGGPAIVEEVSAYLADPEPRVRRGALVGLLRCGASEAGRAAGGALAQMARSPQPAERVLAAQALGEAGPGESSSKLRCLLQDPDSGVRWAALVAAGRTQNGALWPLVLDQLGSPRLWRAAAASLVAAGKDLVPEVIATAERSGQPPSLQARLIEVAGRIGGERATAWLLSLALDSSWNQLSRDDPVLRTHVLRALHRCDYRAKADQVTLIQDQIKAETAWLAGMLAAQTDLGQDEAFHLLHAALDETQVQGRERVFYLLTLLYDRSAVLNARDSLECPSTRKRAYALELLDVLLHRSLKPMVFPFLSDLSQEQKLRQLATIFPQPQHDAEERLHEIIIGRSEWFTPWLRVCALYAAGRIPAPTLRDAVQRALSAPEPLVRETAIWTLGALDRSELEGLKEGRMLTIVERVLALKRVDVFAGTPDETLAAVAELLEEVRLDGDEAVFGEGDRGDCLYIVVDGDVRIHRGQLTISHLGEGDVFGEMALLDAEPRMASATAVVDTLLLRLAQEPFFELMDDRPEVARGIIRVLSQRLRASPGKLRARFEKQGGIASNE
jgi:HEAT repeat protein